MGNRVKRLWPFMKADYRAAEEYLQQMAEKGLMLKSLDPLWMGLFPIATYEKVRPQKRKYCIDGFSGDEEKAEEYLQLAKDAGWEITAADYGFAFFVSHEGEEPAPMQTDWQNGYRQIRKSFWRQDIPMGIILLLALALLNTIENFQLWDLLMMKESVSAGVFFIIFILFSLVPLVRAVNFYIRSEKAIRRDTPMQPRTMKTARLLGLTHSFTGIGLTVFCFGVFLKQMIMDWFV